MIKLPKRIEDKIAYCPESGCWIWMSWTMPGINGDYGYGQVHWAGKTHCAHRVVYELLRGPIPEGLDIDHLCRVRCCVNPDHLEPVTRSENLKRGNGPEVTRFRHAAKTHCPHGHPYSGDNLCIALNGQRVCKECNRIRARRYYHERKKRDQNRSIIDNS